MPEVEELREGDPRALVEENARRKARAVAGERVLGADTAVVLGERIFGKPADAGRGGGLPARPLRPRARGDERDRAG